MEGKRDVTNMMCNSFETTPVESNGASWSKICIARNIVYIHSNVLVLVNCCANLCNFLQHLASIYLSRFLLLLDT